jgi:two-component system, response regulator YesN
VNPKVAVAVRFVHNNHHRDIYLDEVARLVKLSRSRFCHLFKCEVGISFNQFVKQVRLEKACQLLETSFETVKQVAVEAGYKDPDYFEREFHKTFGCTPSRYRAQYLLQGLRQKREDFPANSKFP